MHFMVKNSYFWSFEHNLGVFMSLIDEYLCIKFFFKNLSFKINFWTDFLTGAST